MHSIVFDVRLLRQLSVVLEKTIGKIKANQLTSNIDMLVKKVYYNSEELGSYLYILCVLCYIV
jgi:hypothetical protein